MRQWFGTCRIQFTEHSNRSHDLLENRKHWIFRIIWLGVRMRCGRVQQHMACVGHIRVQQKAQTHYIRLENAVCSLNVFEIFAILNGRN